MSSPLEGMTVLPNLTQRADSINHQESFSNLLKNEFLVVYPDPCDVTRIFSFSSAPRVCCEECSFTGRLPGPVARVGGRAERGREMSAKSHTHPPVDKKTH